MALVLIGAIAAGVAHASEGAAPGNYDTLFDALWSKVDENFYDPHFHGVDWKASRERYRARLGSVRNDKEFEALADAMLGELKTSHTFILPPSGSSASSVGIGVRFHKIDGAWLATDVSPLSDAFRAGLRPGALLRGEPQALRGEAGTPVQVAVQNCDGRSRTISVKRESAFWPAEQPGFRWSSIDIGGERIGYLRIDRFDDGAAELADRAMADLKDTKGLIVDIRGNTGGNASALRLASYFGKEETPTFVLLSRPWLLALGHPVTHAEIAGAPKVQRAYTDAGVFRAVGEKGGGAAFWTEDMGDKRYTAPVVVLTGEDTGSAAEGFVWFMRLKTQAKIVGRATAGAFLGGETFDLPYGWSVTLPVYGLWGPDGGDYGDKPVTPDIAIAQTRRDICKRNDRDIDTAMALLSH